MALRMVLMTSHRRESWGAELENICGAILDLVESFPDIRVDLSGPPESRTCGLRWRRMLGNRDRVHLIPPVDYFQFLSLLRRCYWC